MAGMPSPEAMAAAAAELAAKLAGTGVGGLDMRPMEKITKGSAFVVRVATAIFSTPTSGDQIGKVDVGDRVVATGPPVSQGYFTMVPIRPKGAVDLSMLQPLDLRVRRPCVVGSWDGFQKNEMEWDQEMSCYHFHAELGRTGCERFQIQCNGDWQMILHPDRDNSSPYVQHKLCGPDNEGEGKDWVIGKHPADKGGKGVTYLIRLVMHHDGRPKHVDWVRTSEDTESEGEGAAADAPDLQPDAPVVVLGLKGPRGQALNGSDGVCEAWDAQAGRWYVRLASGEVRAFRPKHLSLCCDDVSGYWHDQRSTVVKIEQDGSKVRVTAPCQPWSPAIGSMSGSVLTISAPSNVPCFAATVIAGDIKWVNDSFWRRSSEDEFRIAVAREAKMKKKAALAKEKGIPLGDVDSEDELPSQVIGPMAAFLKGSRRGATPPRTPEETAHRPRLGVDVKPALPSRGFSPTFRHKSFCHNQEQRMLALQNGEDGKREEIDSDEDDRPRVGEMPWRGKRRPHAAHAFALALPAPDPDEEEDPAPAQPPRRAAAVAAGAAARNARSAAAAAARASREVAEEARRKDPPPSQPSASSSGAGPSLEPAAAAETAPAAGQGGEAVPSIEELLARLDRDEDAPPLGADDDDAHSGPGHEAAAGTAGAAEQEVVVQATEESVAPPVVGGGMPSVEEVLARLDREEEDAPALAPAAEAEAPAGGDYFPSVEEVLARLDREEEPTPAEPAPGQGGGRDAAFPSVEEILARLDGEPEGAAEVDEYARARSSGRTAPPAAPVEEAPREGGRGAAQAASAPGRPAADQREELPQASGPPAAAAAAWAADLPDEPAPDIDGLLARLDLEEQEAMERDYYEQVANIQRKLAGRL